MSGVTVPVSVIHDILDDAFLVGLFVKGVEVAKVRRFGRRIPAAVRDALRVRDHGTCTIEGCSRNAYLEIDHNSHTPKADPPPTTTSSSSASNTTATRPPPTASTNPTPTPDPTHPTPAEPPQPPATGARGGRSYDAPVPQSAVDDLIAAARPRADRGQHLPGREPRREAAARVRRPGRGPGARGRGPHRRPGRLVGALAARLLPPTGRPVGADPLRGRPHPRRSVVHDPAGGGGAARTADLQPVGVLPRARGRLRPPAPVPRRRPAGRQRCPTSRTRWAAVGRAARRLVRATPPDRHALRRMVTA